MRSDNEVGITAAGTGTSGTTCGGTALRASKSSSDCHQTEPGTCPQCEGRLQTSQPGCQGHCTQCELRGQ